MQTLQLVKSFVAVIALMAGSSQCVALQGYSTCHASGTTALDVSGVDTPDAKMVSAITMPDALEGCQRNNNLKGQALRRCAQKELAEQGSSRVKVFASCRKGTLAVEYQPVSGSMFYRGPGHTYTERYKLPLEPTCGGDNLAAIGAFKTLCPSYEGKIEDPN